MSKKQDEAVGMLVIIVLLVIAVLFLIVIVTPIVFVVGFLIYSFKFLPYRQINGNLSDFWLNDKQKEDFKMLTESLESANQKIDEANNIADSQGISRNMDGSISARSNKGKELKCIVEENEYTIYNLSERYEDLKHLPYKNWENFSQVFIIKNSFISALIVYVLSAFIMISISYDSFILGVNSFISFPSAMFSDELTRSEDGNVMLVVILSSVISFFIGVIIFKGISKEKSPIPTEVNSNNVDKY